MDKVPPQNLINSPKTERFLEELNEHHEDAGGHHDLGTAVELAETFNEYARPRRNLLIGMIIFISLYSFLSSTGSLLSLALDATIYEPDFMHSNLWRYFIVIPGAVLTMPAIFIWITPLSLIGRLFEVQNELLIFLVQMFIPFIAAAFWTLAAYLFSFRAPSTNRKTIKHKRYADQ